MVALRGRLAADPWAGPVNARAVLAVVLGLGANLYGHDGLSVRVYASQRRLSELAGLSLSATNRALTWLETHGWLARSEPGRGGALGWHLGGQFRRWVDQNGVVIESKMSVFGTVESLESNYSTVSKTDILTPFDGALLGHVVEVVYRALTDLPQTARALALGLDLHRTTIAGHLDRLAAVGLAERITGGWILGAGTLDEAAVKLGAVAVIEGRKEKHAAERAADEERKAAKLAALEVEAESTMERALMAPDKVKASPLFNLYLADGPFYVDEADRERLGAIVRANKPLFWKDIRPEVLPESVRASGGYVYSPPGLDSRELRHWKWHVEGDTTPARQRGWIPADLQTAEAARASLARAVAA